LIFILSDEAVSLALLLSTGNTTEILTRYCWTTQNLRRK